MVRALRPFVLVLAAAILLPGLVLAASNLNVDRTSSDSLTKYLHNHRLPLIGAQVSVKPDGSRHILLYGFVATDFGKQDAEKKARRYLHDQTAEMDNHIHIDPSIRHLKKYRQPPPEQSAEPGAPPSSPHAPADTDWEHDVDAYLNRGGVSPSNDPNLKMPPPGPSSPPR